MCPRARVSAAALPRSHAATLLTTSYVTSSSLEKVKKRDFLEKRGWVSGPLQRRVMAAPSLSCLLWQKVGLQPPRRRTELCTGASP